MKNGLYCCLEDCDARFGPKVKASASTFLSIGTIAGSLSQTETAAFTRKITALNTSRAAGYTAPDDCVRQKLNTLELGVGGMKWKYLQTNAQRNKAAYKAATTVNRPS